MAKNEKSNRYARVDFSDDFNYISNAYISRFSWHTNLIGFRRQYIETQLFARGCLALIKDDTLGHLLLPASPVAQNVYGEPTNYLVSGLGYQKLVDTDKLVAIYADNCYAIPAIAARRYCIEVADIFGILRVYKGKMRNPTLLAADAENDYSMEVLGAKIDANENFIRVKKSLVEGNIMALPLGRTGQDMRAIYLYRQSLLNELFCRFGLRTEQLQKAAQMSQDEIEANTGMADYNYNAAICARNGEIDTKLATLFPDVELRLEQEQRQPSEAADDNAD